jgi:hypothetical protein
MKTEKEFLKDIKNNMKLENSFILKKIKIERDEAWGRIEILVQEQICEIPYYLNKPVTIRITKDFPEEIVPVCVTDFKEAGITNWKDILEKISQRYDVKYEPAAEESWDDWYDREIGPMGVGYNSL